MLTVHARRLMATLATNGSTRIDVLAMAQSEIRDAIDELARLHDDDGRPVNVLASRYADGELVALELTPNGKSLARALSAGD